ncbi:undecaprenyldiphospho-muramoylpentapeptide beta-N-acetylglucosaminyltransferase [Quadrisphaera sp. GCM10027208]|uniref:undecaprenyldiphospho-muramoylpentapeptide beta-N-acetylglucosaminyltransferase n=1 Tax=Quadrisphaera sp. GCM10027208 TaxID=3273423 RepID=UPI003613D016|nr:undecaprenyldiphospho-muramoylpentapeptide beta-N-acetylglucosaminyltransferase [Kineosporiaceae bacterium SCSIO 59966]
MSEGLAVLLAGGGTAGHVAPLLATADRLRADDPRTRVLVLGTTQGLEARLVPERGYELAVVPRVPMPRRPGADLLRLPGRLRGAVRAAQDAVDRVGADVVVGFGGYVAAPAYLAARRRRVPLVVHEQNRRPGLANRLGARFADAVAVTFADTPLPRAELTGLPMRPEIRGLDREAARTAAREHFGLRPDLTTLLVYGGSLGAQRLNSTVAAVAPDLAAAGVQVLHGCGAGKSVDLPADRPADVPYVVREYLERMDLAYAAADLVVGRAGAGTVCEVTAVGLPAVYVPLPIGNGEQRLNAEPVVRAGGGLLVEDAEFTPQWARARLLPLLADRAALAETARRSAALGVRDGDERLAAVVRRVAAARGGAR